MAIWVPSVANQGNETEPAELRNRTRGYSSVSSRENAVDSSSGGREHVELSVVKDANVLRSFDALILDDLKVVILFLKLTVATL